MSEMTAAQADITNLEGRFIESWGKSFAIVDTIDRLNPEEEVNVESLKWLMIMLKDLLGDINMVAERLFSLIPRERRTGGNI